MSKWHGGKGSNQRKNSVSQSQFSDNWDAIFGKKDKPSAVDDCATAKAESAANEKQDSVSEKSS